MFDLSTTRNKKREKKFKTNKDTRSCPVFCKDASGIIFFNYIYQTESVTFMEYYKIFKKKNLVENLHTATKKMIFTKGTHWFTDLWKRLHLSLN